MRKCSDGRGWRSLLQKDSISQKLLLRLRFYGHILVCTMAKHSSMHPVIDN